MVVVVGWEVVFVCGAEMARSVAADDVQTRVLSLSVWLWEGIARVARLERISRNKSKNGRVVTA